MYWNSEVHHHGQGEELAEAIGNVDEKWEEQSGKREGGLYPHLIVDQLQV
jgi:hypothetical protein